MASVDMQWLFYSDERIEVQGPLVYITYNTIISYLNLFQVFREELSIAPISH